MTEFKLKRIEQVSGRNTFYKLLKNGICEFDEFCKKMNKPDMYQSELKTIFTYMELAANQQTLPRTKFKDITPKNDSIKEHEIKTKHLERNCYNLKSIGLPESKLSCTLWLKITWKKTI